MFSPPSQPTPNELARRAMGGDPPYLAYLLDSRSVLTHAQWNTYPQLHSKRLFVVEAHALDRDEQHPGLWLKPQLYRPGATALLLPDELAATVPFPEKTMKQSAHGASAAYAIRFLDFSENDELWLNVDWCTTDITTSVN